MKWSFQKVPIAWPSRGGYPLEALYCDTSQARPSRRLEKYYVGNHEDANTRAPRGHGVLIIGFLIFWPWERG